MSNEQQAQSQTEGSQPTGQESSGNGQVLGPEFRQQIAQAVHPIVEDISRQVADTVRQQMQEALSQTQEDVRKQVDQAMGSQRRQGEDSQAGASGQAEGQQGPLQSSVLETVNQLRQTFQSLVRTLRDLLQTVQSLLRAVVSLLQALLTALRQALSTAAVGQSLGSALSKVLPKLGQTVAQAQ